MMIEDGDGGKGSGRADVREDVGMEEVNQDFRLK